MQRRLCHGHGGNGDNQVAVEKPLAASLEIGIPDERMGAIGKVFVVLRPGASATETELADWARAHMANTKVPRGLATPGSMPRIAWRAGHAFQHGRATHSPRTQLCALCFHGSITTRLTQPFSTRRPTAS
ncbi:hypothetical protein [Novosphingobium sp. FKTRR1]|uniref:AMP-binding enzyme n=1 Tax=Novosphingobium sp. FKTRR1 TaxID=2879118 RepID=UPI001CEFEDAC|nr:hypothetical protein [Novosphingobium sp. FKTRR1]